MFGVIYKITNLINDKCYIGQTTEGFDKRVKRHLRDDSRCPVIKAAIKKYGKQNFMFKVLCECEDIDDLNIKEIYYIKKFNSYVDDGGYNLTYGGGGSVGYKHTTLTKEIMSKIHKGKVITSAHREKISKANKGRKRGPRSIEHIRKLVESRAGYKHSIESKERISKATAGKNNPMYGKKHSVKTLERISKSLKGKKRPQELVDRTAISNSKPIVQLTIDGKFIKEWPSTRIAGDVLNIAKSNITMCCKGSRYKTAGGYKWKYKGRN